MSDSVAVGVLVASALSLGAEAVKATVGELVKDAYAALKTKVSVWAAGDIAELEKAPKSNARKAVIAEVVDSLSADDQSELRALAETLSEKLLKNATPVGIDIDELNALNVELSKTNVTEGTGIRIRKAEVPGTLKIEETSVGRQAGKP